MTVVEYIVRSGTGSDDDKFDWDSVAHVRGPEIECPNVNYWREIWVSGRVALIEIVLGDYARVLVSVESGDLILQACIGIEAQHIAQSVLC